MNKRVITWCLPFLLASSAAQAGDLYKCTVNGASVYQDIPCKGGNPSKRAMGATSAAGSLAELNEQIRAAYREESEVSDQMNQELRTAMVRLGPQADREASRRERERILAIWQPRYQAARQRAEGLVAELRRRCPGGSVLNSRSQQCSK